MDSLLLNQICAQMRIPRRDITNLIQALNINLSDNLTQYHVNDNCNILVNVIQEIVS